MPSISIEEYKKLRQQGLSPGQISEQVNQKTTGLIPKVGKFLGMEEFGKGLGQFAFSFTKEKKELIAYCEKNGYEYTECPRYIRVLENAISIEVKRK